MQGVIGVLLLILAAILIYDVFAGKSMDILGLINGSIETATPAKTLTGG